MVNRPRRTCHICTERPSGKGYITLSAHASHTRAFELGLHNTASFLFDQMTEKTTLEQSTDRQSNDDPLPFSECQLAWMANFMVRNGQALSSSTQGLSFSSNSDSTKVPPSKTPPATGTEMPTFMPLGGAGSATPAATVAARFRNLGAATVLFDPVTALRILDLDFIEMSDMLPDAWQVDSNLGSDLLLSSC